MNSSTMTRGSLPMWRDWPWQRLTALTGLLYVGLTVAGALVSGDDPGGTGSVETIRAYFVDNRARVLASVYLDGLAIACLLAFAAGLGALVISGGGDPFGALARLLAIGAVGMSAVTLLEDMAEAALAFRAAQVGEPGAIETLYDIVLMVPLSAIPGAVFLGAAASGVLRAGLVPRWLGWVALIPALLMLVGAAGLGDPRGSVASLGFFGGFAPMLLWTLVTSLWLLRGELGREPSAARPKPAVA
jgi:hypothetical protein